MSTKSHRCAAIGCANMVHPRLLMCSHHWKRTPLAIQRAVWAAFRREQIEDGSKASPEWRLASMQAVAAVAKSERRPLPTNFDAEFARWTGVVQRKQEKPDVPGRDPQHVLR